MYDLEVKVEREGAYSLFSEPVESSVALWPVNWKTRQSFEREVWVLVDNKNYIDTAW